MTLKKAFFSLKKKKHLHSPACILQHSTYTSGLAISSEASTPHILSGYKSLEMLTLSNIKSINSHGTVQYVKWNRGKYIDCSSLQIHSTWWNTVGICYPCEALCIGSVCKLLNITLLCPCSKQRRCLGRGVVTVQLSAQRIVQSTGGRPL